MASVVALAGCAATGALFSPPEAPAPGAAQFVVYRTSRFGGTAGTWVPTRLEIEGIRTKMLPADSFVVLEVPAGDVRLSATDLVDLRFDDKNKMMLDERVSGGEIAYFRILSIFGAACEQKADDGVISHATQHPRRDWAQTTCFQRVPEAVALKELKGLRQADQPGDASSRPSNAP